MGKSEEYDDIPVYEGTNENMPLLTYHKLKRSLAPSSDKTLTFATASLTASTCAQPSNDRHVSSLIAGWSISSVIQGTGILGIPFAVQQGGWVGVAMIFIVAWICGHTAKLLIRSMYETSRYSGSKHRIRVNFPEIGNAAFGKPGRVFVEVIQTIEMFGVTIMCIILLGATTKDLLKGTLELSFDETAAVTSIFILPLLFVKRVSIISILSAVAGVSCVLAVITFLAFATYHHTEWRLSNIQTFNYQTFPIGFGVIVLSYCGHAAFPSIEGSMKRPHHYDAAVNTSFFLAAIVRGSFGVCWVLLYGATTDQVATVNMTEATFGTTATVLVMLNALLILPLVLRVVSELFDQKLLKFFPHMNEGSGYNWLWLLITRPLLLGFGLLISVLVPQFGLVMGFVGNISGTFLSFIFPCVFYMKIHWRNVQTFEVIINCLITLFGGLVGTMGMIFSGKELIKSFLK